MECEERHVEGITPIDEAGTFLASIAKEIALNRRPIAPPCVLIVGGETTTVMDDKSGLGGPSQELALEWRSLWEALFTA